MHEKKERRRNLTTAILSLSLLTVMPMLSMAMYLAQFTTPMLLSLLGFAPYLIAAGTAAIFVIWSITIKLPTVRKGAVTQEA